MKNKKINKKILMLSSLALVPVSVIIACGSSSSSDSFEKWIGSKRDLRTTLIDKQGNLAAKWFATIGAFSNLGNYKGLNDAQGRLISTWQYDFVDSNGSKKIKKYLRLRLAKKIIITYGSGTNAEFDDDKKSTALTNSKNINHANFRTILKRSDVKKVQFILKDNLFWVNNKGEKTKHKLVNKDFLTGFRYQLINTIPEIRYSLSNEGRVDAKGNLKISAKEQKMIDDQKVVPNFYNTSSVDNRYLFQLAGLKWENFFGIKTSIQNKKEVASIDQPLGEKIAPKNNSNQLNFEFEADTSPFVWFDFLTNDHSFPFSPIPHEYANKLPYDEDYSLQSTNKLGALGFYKYGRTPITTLFISPYYISKNDDKIFQVKKNNYYDAIPEIRDNKKSILSHTLSFSKSADLDTAPIQNLNRFTSGNDYIVTQSNYDNLPHSKKTNILSNEKEVITKTLELNSKSTNNQSSWSLLPKSEYTKNGKPNATTWNDGFSKMMYGVAKSDLETVTTKSIYDHILTKGAVFKSLIHGAINWEQYITQSFNGNGTFWPYNVAINSSISSKKAHEIFLKTFSGNKKGVDTPLLLWDETNSIIKQETISGKENYRIATTVSDARDVWKSHKFADIKANLAKLGKAIFGSNKTTVSFDIPTRAFSQSKNDQTVYKNIADTLESLSTTNLKIVIKEQGTTNRDAYSPTRDEILDSLLGFGSHSFNGWNSDFDDAFGNWAGLLQINSYQQNAWFRLLSYISKGNLSFSSKYPQVTRIADWFEGKYNALITNYISEIEANKAQYLTASGNTNWDPTIKRLLNKKFNAILDGNFKKSATSDDNSLIKILLDNEYDNLKDGFLSSTIKFIDNIPKFNFKKWTLNIQKDVFNNNEADMKKAFEEIELISGFSLQYSRNGNYSPYGSPRTTLFKKWLKATPSKQRFDLISEWELV